MRSEVWDEVYERLNKREDRSVAEERLHSILDPNNSPDYIRRVMEDNPDMRRLMSMLSN